MIGREDNPNMTRNSSSAAAQLLNREIPRDYQQQWTEIVAAAPSNVETNLQSAVVFRIGPEWLALSSTVVQEVAEKSVMHRLPHRSTGILKGIVNVRGEILLCVALDVLLRIEHPAGERSAVRRTEQRLLVCNRHGDRLAFLVDEVHGIHRYLARSLREVPATLARAEAKYTSGILPWRSNQSIGRLDDELVFYALNRGLA
jgi:chemotaxis-related protein WspD